MTDERKPRHGPKKYGGKCIYPSCDHAGYGKPSLCICNKWEKEDAEKAIRKPDTRTIEMTFAQIQAIYTAARHYLDCRYPTSLEDDLHDAKTILEKELTRK